MLSRFQLIFKSYNCKQCCKLRIGIRLVAAFDVSADLTELGKTPITVICAGVKSILDIGLTLEYLVCLSDQLTDALFIYEYDCIFDKHVLILGTLH